MRAHVGELGGLSAVALVMAQCPEQEEIQLNGCIVIMSLMRGNGTSHFNQWRAMRANCLQVLVEAMRTFR